ncbi:hypothetical protein ACIBHX_46955 [Nonomuraea sp. NPDC050536]|uniref:hypothetical protein n=1 Tax=Nonomuraea sp. NPDC050536 TaxID=3364366 RepID=UPI0037C9C090
MSLEVAHFRYAGVRYSGWRLRADQYAIFDGGTEITGFRYAPYEASAGFVMSPSRKPSSPSSPADRDDR